MGDQPQHPTPPRPGPGDQVIGFTESEVAAIRKTTEGGNRNPAQVVDAFVGDDGITVHGRTIGPFTLGHFLFLELLEHPAADAQANRPMTNMETATVIFVLCRPVAENRKVLANGRQAFDEEVLQFADTIPFNQLPAFGLAIRQLMAREFATVSGGNDDGDASKKKMDTMPRPNPTDSAGD